MVQLRGISDTDEIVRRVEEACALRAASEPRRGYLGMSQVGEPCGRKTWLAWRAERRPPIDGRLARIFDNGRSVEERVVRDLEAGGYAVDGRQLAFEDFGGRFRGHCDGVIHGVTAEPHVLEIKSANDSGFRRFQLHGVAGKPVYAGQIQLYMGYSGLKRALFVVENKNTQALYMERVPFDRRAFAELRERAWRILNAETAPAKSPGPGDCWWCGHKESCGS